MWGRSLLKALINGHCWELNPRPYNQLLDLTKVPTKPPALPYLPWPKLVILAEGVLVLPNMKTKSTKDRKKREKIAKN